MGGLSIWHWLIVLVIVVVIFGTKKLANAGADLGSAVKNFKKAMNEGEAEAKADEQKRSAIDEKPQASAPSSSTEEKHQEKV